MSTREALEKLAVEWEKRAERCRAATRAYDGGGSDMQADAYDLCADDLRDALAALEGMGEPVGMNPSGWVYTDNRGDIRVTFCPDDLDDDARGTCVPFIYAGPPLEETK